MTEESPQVKFKNIPEGDIPIIKDSLRGQREYYRTVLAEALVPRESIDPRIIDLENKLNQLNTARSAHYGLFYEKPEVFYVDRGIVTDRMNDINQKLKAKGINSAIEAYGGRHFANGNFILLFINNFDDLGVDAYDTAWRLRHEMGHAGSTRNFTAYPSAENKTQIYNTRYGGYLESPHRSTDAKRVGLVFDQGHRAIEDAIFEGKEEEEYRMRDKHLPQLPSPNELFPGSGEHLESLTTLAKKKGLLQEGWGIMYLKLKGSELLFGRSWNYDDYRQLMKQVYSGSQELYGLGTDFIYGGKKLPFARRLNQVYGDKFFTTLMNTTNRQEAKDLLQRIN